jgi:hypothetical protein
MNQAFRSNLVKNKSTADKILPHEKVMEARKNNVVAFWKYFPHSVKQFKIKRRLKAWGIPGRAGYKGEQKARIAARKRK